MSINFNIIGADIIKAKLSRFTQHIKNWKPLFEMFGDEFRAIMREQFASEGAHGGAGWAALTPEYKKWKDSHRPGRTILVSYGNLYSSLVNKNDSNSVEESTEDQLIIGTKDPKAAYHHYGKGFNPERKIIAFSQEDNTRWVKKAHEWCFVQLRAKGIGY